MEEQSHDTTLQLTNWAFVGGSSMDSCYSQVYPSYHFPFQSNGNLPLVSTTLPHWIDDCQQTPQNYVDFMLETGASQVGREISFFNPSLSSGFIPINASTGNSRLEQVDYLQPSNEVAPLNNLTAFEHLIPAERSNQGCSDAARGLPPKVPKSKRNTNVARAQKSNNDRRQKAKIAERLQAMKELLPHKEEHPEELIVDDIMDLIKCLRTQIKDLSQSKLGGEPSSIPLLFHEDYGHFLHGELMNGPLEDVIGKLLEVNPLAATELLESRGLYMMPATLLQGLPPNI